MKPYNNIIKTYKETDWSEILSVGFKDKINILIIFHLLAFVIYRFFGWSGLLDQPLANGTLNDYIDHFLVVSSNAQDVGARWSIGLFTYQFVHFKVGELILSISMLWLFGHILQKRFTQIQIVLFYFGFAIFSAIVFNISHLVFPVFSGPSGLMEGAFGGVLGVMSMGVFYYGNEKVLIGSGFRFRLWHAYALALFLSLLFVYKNNMAYILVYIFTILAGFRYAEKRGFNHTKKRAKGL